MHLQLETWVLRLCEYLYFSLKPINSQVRNKTPLELTRMCLQHGSQVLHPKLLVLAVSRQGSCSDQGRGCKRTSGTELSKVALKELPENFFSYSFVCLRRILFFCGNILSFLALGGGGWGGVGNVHRNRSTIIKRMFPKKLKFIACFWKSTAFLTHLVWMLTYLYAYIHTNTWIHRHCTIYSSFLLSPDKRQTVCFNIKMYNLCHCLFDEMLPFQYVNSVSPH